MMGTVILAAGEERKEAQTGKFIQPIGAEYHTKSHETQQSRHSKFAGKAICYDAG